MRSQRGERRGFQFSFSRDLGFQVSAYQPDDGSAYKLCGPRRGYGLTDRRDPSREIRRCDHVASLPDPLRSTVPSRPSLGRPGRSTGRGRGGSPRPWREVGTGTGIRDRDHEGTDRELRFPGADRTVHTESRRVSNLSCYKQDTAGTRAARSTHYSLHGSTHRPGSTIRIQRNGDATRTHRPSPEPVLSFVAF
jgi:hypothetical protein